MSLCNGRDRNHELKLNLLLTRYVMSSRVTNLTLISTIFNTRVHRYYTGVHLFSLFLCRRVSFPPTVLLLRFFFRQLLGSFFRQSWPLA